MLESSVMDLSGLDLQAFITRVGHVRSDPVQTTRAARALVNGALRIRTGCNGLYGIATPITRPTEAVGAWISSIESDLASGDFHRHAEAREALVAAAEEVDSAVKTIPKAKRLRNALYIDALGALAQPESSDNIWPFLAGILGGILVVVLINLRTRR